jgi:hypothetical protein
MSDYEKEARRIVTQITYMDNDDEIECSYQRERVAKALIKAENRGYKKGLKEAVEIVYDIDPDPLNRIGNTIAERIGNDRG